jgi:hypothetical protein
MTKTVKIIILTAIALMATFTIGILVVKMSPITWGLREPENFAECKEAGGKHYSDRRLCTYRRQVFLLSPSDEDLLTPISPTDLTGVRSILRSIWLKLKMWLFN